MHNDPQKSSTSGAGQAHDGKTAGLKPASSRHITQVLASLCIGYVLTIVVTGHNIHNWAKQLPVTKTSQRLERMTHRWAVGSKRVGTEKLTLELEQGFSELHDAAQNPLRLDTSTSKKPSNKVSLNEPLRATPLPTTQLTQKPLNNHGAALPKKKPEPIPEATPAPAKGRILLVGDSLMAGLVPQLSQALRTDLGLRTSSLTKIGMGLARLDMFDWPSEFKKQLKGENYEAIVLLLGANDTQNLKEGKRGFIFGGRHWQPAYRHRVDTMMALACKHTSRVYWLGLPPMRDPQFQERTALLNQVIADRALRQACVRFIPMDQPLASVAGQFTSYLRVNQRDVRVRASDGIHFTPAGSRLITGYLLPFLFPKGHGSRDHDMAVNDQESLPRSSAK